LALTSPTSGGRSGGIVRLRTKTTEFMGISLLLAVGYSGCFCSTVVSTALSVIVLYN
jgi:hypothetical protein